MVDIKTAVSSAIEFAKSLLGSDRTTSIRLEEIESSSAYGREVWLITLSSPSTGEGSLAGLRSIMGADASREYKVFTVSKEDGQVLSMKIRLLESPAMK